MLQAQAVSHPVEQAGRRRRIRRKQIIGHYEIPLYGNYTDIQYLTTSRQNIGQSDNLSTVVFGVDFTLALKTMDIRTLTKLLLKLAGLYLLATALTSVPSALATPAEYVAILYVSLSLYAVAGLALVLFPGVIINHVIRIKGPELEGSLTATAMLRVGVMLVGFCFAFSAIYSAAFIWAKTQLFYVGTHPIELLPDDKASLFAAGIQIFLGLVFWFSGGLIVRVTEGLSHDR